jgi:hypothetical protein
MLKGERIVWLFLQGQSPDVTAAILLRVHRPSNTHTHTPHTRAPSPFPRRRLIYRRRGSRKQAMGARWSRYAHENPSLHRIHWGSLAREERGGLVQIVEGGGMGCTIPIVAATRWSRACCGFPGTTLSWHRRNVKQKVSLANDCMLRLTPSPSAVYGDVEALGPCPSPRGCRRAQDGCYPPLCQQRGDRRRYQSPVQWRSPYWGKTPANAPM